MLLPVPFDATTIQPSTGKGICFPLGDYLLEIVKTEGQPVKGSADKGMLVLTYKVIDQNNPLNGQTHVQRFNLWNDNQDTVRIAYSQLSAVMHVIGRLQIQDSNQLIGGKLIATIGPQDNNPDYSEVKAVKDIYGNPPGQQGPAPAPQPVAQAVAVQVAPPAPQAAPNPPQAPWSQPAPAQAQPAAPWSNGGAPVQVQQPVPTPQAQAPWTTQTGGAAAPPWAK